MANKQHIQWLLEGVEAWNKRREREDFVPNLAGVNLYKKFQEAGKLDSNGQIPLSGINLSSCADPSKVDPISADLADVYPSRASFTGGKIFRAQPWETPSLTGAYLGNADLSGADLSGAALSSANLSSTDLSHACLTGADLSHACLTGANLSQADLSHADLSNANLTKTIVVDANLVSAKLINTNISHSQIWKAKLWKARQYG